MIKILMPKKIAFNTRVNETILNEFRALSVLLDRNLNDFFEEAMIDLIRKYDKDNLIAEMRRLKAKAQNRI